MQSRVLQIDPRDDVVIALANLKKGETLEVNGHAYTLATDVPAKHKFAAKDFAPGDPVHMYGVMVGRAFAPIRRGEAVTVHNLRHDSTEFREYAGPAPWRPPDVSGWTKRTFLGYHRSDGEVGTRNYWLVVPLVFCENRNLGVLKEAFEEELGFAQPQVYRRYVAQLVKLYREGRTGEISQQPFSEDAAPGDRKKVFANVDGIKFLSHQLGCGGTRDDARNLCGLIADYIHHPNVAGATVLSLGCQNAQVSLLREEIERRAPKPEKPVFIFEQQSSPSEAAMLGKAMQKTFLGLLEADIAASRASADFQIDDCAEVRRLRRIFRALRKPRARAHLGHARGPWRPDDSRGVSRAVRRRAGIDRSFRAKGGRRPVHPTHARLRRARQGGPCRVSR